MLDQLKKLVAALSVAQRITIVLVTAAAVAGVLAFSHWRQETDFHPLYTGLSAEDAGAVVQKLKETGVQFRLSENGTSVLAPSARVAELRLEMASAGLPKSGRIGFELFDKTNFGATEFAEHVNYRRALEGELERSIMSLSEVEQARVHLTFPKDSVFLESRQPGKASVVLRLRPGTKLSGQNVGALTNLVASAVEGLAPDAVTLLDTRGNLLSRPKRAADPDSPQPSEASLEYRQKIEADLLAKINATLDPLLGAEKFRAAVSIDCDLSSGEQSEETLDPTKSVMTTSQKTEEGTTASAATGAPGTASNLPRPPGRSTAGGAGVSRKTENIAYQTSRLVRHVRLPQGQVKRMSLSVLVDNDLKWEGSGKSLRRILAPPSPERLKAIHDLVAGITGLNSERGDQLVVETLPFESTLTSEPPPTPPLTPTEADPRLPKWLVPILADPKSLSVGIAAGAGVIVLLGALLFLLSRRKRKPSVESPVALGPSVAATSDQQEEQMKAQLAEQAELQKQIDGAALSQLKLPTVTTKKAEVLVRHLRETVLKDGPATSNVLRTWLTESGGGETT
ncbi:MAG: flagellar M-ring protein FliF [Bryobacterales bacterium]|nr:flagellar M-ring protein FliF [Bryobacterales bacterium]